MQTEVTKLAHECGAKDYSPAPMRSVRGLSFTYEQLESFALRLQSEQKHCLHQIQEPDAAEQAAWHAGLDEGRAQAAPVMLPEPDAYVNPSDLSMLARKEPAPKNKAWMFYTPHPELIGVYSVHTLRALLATATGLPAQAATKEGAQQG